MAMDEDISSFISFTSASAEVAYGFMLLASGDIERAVSLYYENPDLVSGVGADLLDFTAAPSHTSPSTSRRPHQSQQDSTGVIHISDDDDDDMIPIEDEGQYGEDVDIAPSDRRAVVPDAARTQEEEDAAMAKRLQEELYSSVQGLGAAEDGVRAPIARTTETLIAPDPVWDSYEGAMASQFIDPMIRRRHLPPRVGGPFGQRVWDDGATIPAPSTENGRHARRLEDLFRPPYELMSRVSWDEARTQGKDNKKWLLVNLQDMNDFNCQALNRDIWKDQAVRELVSENFIFLQYDKDFPDAEEYITFYFSHESRENPDNYPHVSIIDPRTGEQVKVWSGRPFPSAADFYAELAEFLDRYSLAANSKNPVAWASARKPQAFNVDRMTEDEMLEMTLKNSLASGADSEATVTRNMHDPYALTKPLGSSDEARDESRGESSRNKGKGKENEIKPAAAMSLFAQIASNRPHTEPGNEVAATTRIQFRHPDGRVIRRFGLREPVRRIYEWLKAEPLEGKQGLEFELKKMPQGQDLLDSLDRQIGETSLKQGTVMIEFTTVD